MADANLLTTPAATVVTFDYQDCRVCGAIDAPHYRACKGQWCVACHKAYQREYRNRYVPGVKTLNKDKKYTLKKRYGISPEKFDELGRAQGWKCAVCDLTFDISQRAFGPNVDHCHKTGKVRGLLCNGCNRALGFISDNPATARKLADYLERS